ncbi:hypothetical protein COY32_03215 [candidate division WWE3 bacterium CG_4_10_14_0_2_um_filter_41_14]|uniref:Uncharacterized protein n=1 Tax=candidate division WWE3 bacterium CG_4_10_14_0_2_um_filter_41_14 TaxID=1975072 RepID=A0A2M7TJ80_UNCKA|nr:MAG: hypothetical protein COY32_03215 [candidate division WWE3 bacterium CG_4_10_14_0_2_um_filter_41_14]
MVEDIILQKLIKEYGIEGVLLALADVCEIAQEQSTGVFVDLKGAQKYSFCATELHELLDRLPTT